MWNDLPDKGAVGDVGIDIVAQETYSDFGVRAASCDLSTCAIARASLSHFDVSSLS
jgi:hypothetical protein